MTYSSFSIVPYSAMFRPVLDMQDFFVSTIGYSSPKIDRIWLRVYYSKIPIYPIFYLRKGDYKLDDAHGTSDLTT